MPTAWLFVAIAAGLLALTAALRLGLRPLPGQDSAELGSLPPTPLQKRAWLGAAVGVVVTVLLFVVVAVAGPEAYATDPRVRFTVYGLMALGAIPFVWLTLAARSSASEKADERDLAILERAPMVQAPAILVVLAAWTVILTEGYWHAGRVPIVFLTLILWSCLFVAMAALPLGMLLGYRGSR